MCIAFVRSHSYLLASIAGWCLIFAVSRVGAQPGGGAAAREITITDADWIQAGQSAKFTYDTDAEGPVIAVDPFGNIYVTGSAYLSAGGMPVRTIARWDHLRWTEIGSDFEWISAMTFDKQGNLFAAGSSADSSPEPSFIIRKWDGKSWSTINTDMHANITRLYFDELDSLYACTYEHPDSSTYFAAIYKFRNGSWQELGKVLEGTLKDITVDSRGTLYVCGEFSMINGIKASGIARLHSGAWSDVGNGLFDSKSEHPPYIYSMVCIGEAVYVSGSFDSAGTILANGLAKWNGTAWSAVGSYNSWYAQLMGADAAGNLYVRTGGDDLVEKVISKWNGTSWEDLYRGDRGEYVDIDFMDSHGTIYGMISSLFQQLIDGKWYPICDGNGFDDGIGAFAFDSASGNMYVGGWFSTIGNKPIRHIARWDGNDWYPLGEGLPFGPSALAFDKNGLLYAGGYWGGDTLPILSKWDGTSWTSMEMVIPEHEGTYFNRSINSIVFDTNGILYVAGSLDTIAGVAVNHVARWDGTAWHPLGSGITGYEVTSIVFDREGNLYAGGDFDKAGTVIAHNIAKWDGATWSALGSGISKDPDSWAPVRKLIFDKQGNLYVGGNFMYAGGVTVNNIARWDGALWSSLGGGVTNRSGFVASVDALTFDAAGNLYAGGYFTNADISSAGIAKWDGTRWNGLGSGVAYSRFSGHYESTAGVTTLCNARNTLFVGGTFSFAGGKTSVNFARCNLGGTEVKAPFLNSTKRPVIAARDQGGIVNLTVTTPTELRIAVYSLAGRRIFQTTRQLTAGSHTVRLASSGLPRGMFMAQIKAGGETARCRFIIR